MVFDHHQITGADDYSFITHACGFVPPSTTSLFLHFSGSCASGLFLIIHSEYRSGLLLPRLPDNRLLHGHSTSDSNSRTRHSQIFACYVQWYNHSSIPHSQVLNFSSYIAFVSAVVCFLLLSEPRLQ